MRSGLLRIGLLLTERLAGEDRCHVRSCCRGLLHLGLGYRLFHLLWRLAEPLLRLLHLLLWSLLHLLLSRCLTKPLGLRRCLLWSLLLGRCLSKPLRCLLLHGLLHRLLNSLLYWNLLHWDLRRTLGRETQRLRTRYSGELLGLVRAVALQYGLELLLAHVAHWAELEFRVGSCGVEGHTYHHGVVRYLR